MNRLPTFEEQAEAMQLKNEMLEILRALHAMPYDHGVFNRVAPAYIQRYEEVTARLKELLPDIVLEAFL